MDGQLNTVWHKSIGGAKVTRSPANLEILEDNIVFTGSYNKDNFSESIVFAKIKMDGTVGETCGLITDEALTEDWFAVTDFTVVIPADYTQTVSFSTLYVPENTMDLSEQDFCQQECPRLNVYFDDTQGKVVVGVELYPNPGTTIECGDGETDCSEILESLTNSTELTAYPKAGFTFSHWEVDGITQSWGNPVHVAVFADVTWTAVFEVFKLEFPINLNNYTAYSAPVSSVFDHSGSANYGNDDQVIAFNGEKGEEVTGHPAYPGTTCYEKSDESAFGLGFNYTGISGAEDDYLCYDGHPGYDYAVATGTDLYSAAAGTVSVVVSDPNSNTCLGTRIEIEHVGGYTTSYFIWIVLTLKLCNKTST